MSVSDYFSTFCSNLRMNVDNKTPEETAAEIEHWLIQKMMEYNKESAGVRELI